MRADAAARATTWSSRVAGERLELLAGACPRAETWFAARAPAPAPLARIDGAEAPLEAALDAAAAILEGARMPLIFGLGGTSCEAQREAVALADALGASIDTAGALLDGASRTTFPLLGASTATLGDVRDRAQVVVIWRADPASSHPRLLERLRVDAPGRTLIVVDAQRDRHRRARRRVRRAPRGRRLRRAVGTARAGARPPARRVARRRPAARRPSRRCPAAARLRERRDPARRRPEWRRRRASAPPSHSARSSATSAGGRTS